MGLPRTTAVTWEDGSPPCGGGLALGSEAMDSFFFLRLRRVFNAMPEPSLVVESGGSSLVEMHGPLIVGASLVAGHSSRVQGLGVGTHA